MLDNYKTYYTIVLLHNSFFKKKPSLIFLFRELTYMYIINMFIIVSTIQRPFNTTATHPKPSSISEMIFFIKIVVVQTLVPRFRQSSSYEIEPDEYFISRVFSCFYAESSRGIHPEFTSCRPGTIWVENNTGHYEKSRDNGDSEGVSAKGNERDIGCRRRHSHIVSVRPGE